MSKTCTTFDHTADVGLAARADTLAELFEALAEGLTPGRPARVQYIHDPVKDPLFSPSWLNIGGPERLRGKQVAAILTDTLGREIRYDPCTPQQFGRYLVQAAGDAMPEAAREPFAQGIAAFYEYNKSAPTKPFAVDMDHVYDRFPELAGELEPMRDWAARQNWSSGNHRPAFG